MEDRNEITAACLEWWSIDEELEVLTAEHSAVEANLIQKFHALKAARSDAMASELLQSFDQQFARLDERRAAARDTVENIPVITIGDAAKKLAIAARLLGDEGGFEASVVDEVARFLARYDPMPLTLPADMPPRFRSKLR